MGTQYLTCIDCKADFEFTERDQEFYADRGYSTPKRCKPCREKKKAKFEERDRNSAPQF